MFQKMSDLTQWIDHTLLKPQASQKAYLALCEEARQYGFFSVCIPPCWLETCREALKESSVKLCTVIGFPHGLNTTATKCQEAAEAIEQGAHELDMVINLGWAKSGHWTRVTEDIAQVVQAAHPLTVKVILEMSELSTEEKDKAIEAAVTANASFVKTSTGFASGGATIEDVQRMVQRVPGHVGVKASGGIKSLKDLTTFLEAGATRIGCSAGVSIVQEWQNLPCGTKENQ
jgi:deoxyribose-phosphate aldolase